MKAARAAVVGNSRGADARAGTVCKFGCSEARWTPAVPQAQRTTTSQLEKPARKRSATGQSLVSLTS